MLAEKHEQLLSLHAIHWIEGFDLACVDLVVFLMARIKQECEILLEFASTSHLHFHHIRTSEASQHSFGTLRNQLVSAGRLVSNDNE